MRTRKLSEGCGFLRMSEMLQMTDAGGHSDGLTDDTLDGHL